MTGPVAAIGLRAQRGGAVAVGVRVEAGEPRILMAGFIATAAEGDRLAFEPYHVAASMPRSAQGKASAQAAEAVAEGRRRQQQMALQGLQTRIGQAAETPGLRAVTVALLVNRAGWVTDLLDYSLAWPEHAAVAEGLAVRDALRLAAGRCGALLAELDEKSLPELAAQALGLSQVEIEARLKTCGAAAGKPWRKEQKLACLAAWVAAAGGGR